MSRIPDIGTAFRCLRQLPKLLKIYEPESPKLREDVIDSIDMLESLCEKQAEAIKSLNEELDQSAIDIIVVGSKGMKIESERDTLQARIKDAPKRAYYKKNGELWEAENVLQAEITCAIVEIKEES